MATANKKVAKVDDSVREINGFKIEKGVPLPEPRGRKSQFPLATMTTGDSFEYEHVDSASSGIYAAITAFTKKHPGFSFTARKMSERQDGETLMRTTRVYCLKSPEEQSSRKAG